MAHRPQHRPSIRRLDEVLLTAIATTLDSQSGLYRSYAEFDESAAEVSELIRRWMVKTA